MLESDENSRLHRRTIIWELVLCFCVGNLESLNRIMSAMNGWLELGRKRRLFSVCLRTAMLYFSAALALLLSVKAPPVHAQQITRVLPFAGTHSETWEPFGVQEIPLIARFPQLLQRSGF